MTYQTSRVIFVDDISDDIKLNLNAECKYRINNNIVFLAHQIQHMNPLLKNTIIRLSKSRNTIN